MYKGKKYLQLLLCFGLLGFSFLSQNITHVSANSPDGYEPNDTYTDAYLIVPGSINGNLGYNGDSEDWFKISVSGSQRITITVSFQHSISDIDLRLCDTNGYDTIAGSYSVSDQEQISVILATAGIYYIKVYNYGSNFVTYNMVVTLESVSIDHDLYEPNNNYNEAYQITPGQYTGNLGYMGDGNDWFNITLSAYQQIRVDFSSDNSADAIEIKLINTDAMMILKQEYCYDGRQTKLNYIVRTAGTYYIQVSTYSSNFVTYAFNVSLYTITGAGNLNWVSVNQGQQLEWPISYIVESDSTKQNKAGNFKCEITHLAVDGPILDFSYEIWDNIDYFDDFHEIIVFNENKMIFSQRFYDMFLVPVVPKTFTFTPQFFEEIGFFTDFPGQLSISDNGKEASFKHSVPEGQFEHTIIYNEDGVLVYLKFYYQFEDEYDKEYYSLEIGVNPHAEEGKKEEEKAWWQKIDGFPGVNFAFLLCLGSIATAFLRKKRLSSI